MANFSDLTRREQVLARLKAAGGGWVDGPEIANEEVGGSEGLRRLRELADAGYNIRKRHHPDPQRSIWQYRLAPPAIAIPGPEEAAEVLDGLASAVKAGHGTDPSVQQQLLSQTAIEPAEKPVYPQPESKPQTRIADAIKRKEDGTFEYVPPQRSIHEPEQAQLTALPETPQPQIAKFTSLPRKISWGSVAVCPRCRQKTTRGRPPKEVDESTLTSKQRRERERKQKEGTKLVDEDGILLYKDPTSSKTQPCTRCNGYGIVPNIGPVPFTMPG